MSPQHSEPRTKEPDLVLRHEDQGPWLALSSPGRLSVHVTMVHLRKRLAEMGYVINSTEEQVVCGVTEQVNASEVYRCWREKGHADMHHGPLLGHLPVGDEAFLTWPPVAAEPATLDDMEGALHYALGHMSDECECDQIWADIRRFHELSVDDPPVYSKP